MPNQVDRSLGVMNITIKASTTSFRSLGIVSNWAKVMGIRDLMKDKGFGDTIETV